ncbi:MAG: hypothetical protein QNJ46_08680 [Leptolyngbyaceae cyanobacterium MO_188.B28]|nr:hypothetical protein [Leptolyngbyaceae cyanobacterium MO_188.B28]
MNTKIPFLLTLLTTASLLSPAFLLEANPVMANNAMLPHGHRSFSSHRFNSLKWNLSTQHDTHVSQSQQTKIDLERSDLKQPHRLEISADPGVRLRGRVTVNGVLVQELRSNRVAINLSPYLRRGRQTVEISGRYQPASAAVQIEFSGPNSTITQQTSGSGLLNHVLVFNLQ